MDELLKTFAAVIFMTDVSQDAEGLQSLCDLCLAQVCHSLNYLCSRRADGSMSLMWAPLFPQEMADQLLDMMATKGRKGQKRPQHHWVRFASLKHQGNAIP